MTAEVQLEYRDPQVRDPRQLMEEVVIDVMKACERRGRRPDPAVVRELVEREWAGYDDARVQTYLPVLVGRSVRTQMLHGGTAGGVLLPLAGATTASSADRRDQSDRPVGGYSGLALE